MVTFDELRATALSLPEVEESTTYDAPAFRVRGKLFLHLGDDNDALLIRVGRHEKHAIALAEPARFFVNPANEQSPVVATRLSTNDAAHLTELAELIEEAWRRYAPRELVRADPVVGIGSGPTRRRAFRS